jgi:hypothetical protein
MIKNNRQNFLYKTKLFWQALSQYFLLISKTVYGTILVIKLFLYEYWHHLQLIRK